MENFNLYTRIMVSAKTNSGKTFLTRYLLDKYKNDFDKIILSNSCLYWSNKYLVRKVFPEFVFADI